MPIDAGFPRWPLKKLTELGELSRGRSRHRPRHAPHLYGGPYPFIQTGDVKESGGRINSYQQTYSEAGLAQSRLWPAGTLCITIAANIAETGILEFPACFPDSIVGFVADPTICNVRFIEYLFRGIRSQIQFEASDGGTVQDNINVATLDRLRLPIPGKGVQDALAGALSALDDKIELNRRMNQTLESVARAIFRSWFVDFDPVVAKAAGRQPFGMSADVAALFTSEFCESELGAIPKLWKVESISDRASKIQYGYTQSASTWPVGPKFLRITDIQGGRVDWGTVPYCQCSEKDFGTYRVCAGDIVVARTGASTGENIYIADAPSAVFASYLVRVQFANRSVARFVGQFMRTDEYFNYIDGAIGGSAQPNAGAPVLTGARLPFPPVSVTEAFFRLVDASDLQRFRLVAQSQTLAALRDTLLPKLMSGELRILDAEKLVGTRV